ncbi:MAG: hypothetical protein ABI609_16670 [Acidobacteriota bacterium]
MARFEAEVGPLEIRPIPFVPLDQNGAALVLAAGRQIPPAGLRGDLFRHLETTSAQLWLVNDRQTAIGVRAETGKSLELLARAQQLATWSDPVEFALDADREEYFSRVSRLGRTLLIATRLELADGQRERAVRLASLLGRTAIMERGSPGSVRQLIGARLEAQFLNAVSALCEQASSNPEELAAAELQIEELGRLASSRRGIAQVASFVSSNASRFPIDGGSWNLATALALDEMRGLSRATEGPWPQSSQWLAKEGTRLQSSMQNACCFQRLFPRPQFRADILDYLNFPILPAEQWALQSARRAAAFALLARRLRLDRNEATARLSQLSPDAWTGGRIALDCSPDGASALTVPGAQELWEKEGSRRVAPPFRWPVPIC